MEAESELRRAERALGHPVSAVIPSSGGRPLVAGSTVGDPPRARAAWIGPDEEVLARIAAPGGRPSRTRPVVASALTVDLADGTRDHVVVAQLAREARAAAVEVAGEPQDQPERAIASPDGLVIVRLPVGAAPLGVDALDERGEPIGRLARAGIGDLRLEGGTLIGRLGASHGMAAGLGSGAWLRDLDDAELEAGYRPVLPGWVPPGLEAGPPRAEPESAYPTAPPTIVSVWRGEGSARVILRQAPAPLAQPERPGPRARAVDIRGHRGVLRARGMALLVWETPVRAFGLQVRGVPDPVEAALRIARSIPSMPGAVEGERTA